MKSSGAYTFKFCSTVIREWQAAGEAPEPVMTLRKIIDGLEFPMHGRTVYVLKKRANDGITTTPSAAKGPAEHLAAPPRMPWSDMHKCQFESASSFME